MVGKALLNVSLLLGIAAFGADSALAQSGPAAGTASGADGAAQAVIISMEGETHRLVNINWAESSVTIEGDEIRVYLAEDGNPVTLNFNLSNTGILDAGAAEYVLPGANAASASVDLNFFNRTRNSSRMQRRIVFDEGTIEVHTFTRSALSMTFRGSGHPLMDPTRIPIEGSVNVAF